MFVKNKMQSKISGFSVAGDMAEKADLCTYEHEKL